MPDLPKEAKEAIEGEKIEAAAQSKKDSGSKGSASKSDSIQTPAQTQSTDTPEVNANCQTCSHSSLLHYGTEKRQCNTENCSCIEFK